MEGIRLSSPVNPLLLLGGILFVIGFVVFAVSGFSAVANPTFGVPDFSGVLLGWIIGAVGVLVMAGSRWRGRSSPIPPPPPIQQPMVPAGTQGTVSLNCPACGAPAQDMDRFGVAVCAHCGTRFLVR